MTDGARTLPRAAPALAAALLLAAAPAAAQSSPPPSLPAHDTVLIESRVLGESRTINVYTPPGYDADTAATWPILYMPDGGVAEDFPRVAATIDSLIAAGRIRPVLVVGIENTERRRDMTGPTAVAKDSTIAPRVGGSAAFRAFIRDELMPEIGRRYRSSGETAIVGESLAGLFVVETLLREPALFDHYIALSPSVWWNGGALVASAGAADAIAGTATVYLASADEDEIIAGTAALADALRARAPGLRVLYEPRPDLQHATVFRGAGPAAFAKVLR